ncbi:MAG TPA: isocitrate lyase, partial [SAR86 cluster bacterium]|nr:isocitrate lyase [SAR86 cluster bacterium]
MADYKTLLDELSKLKNEGKGAHVNINPEHAARMRLQNQFQSGIDIAKYTASIMRKDMEEFDA